MKVLSAPKVVERITTFHMIKTKFGDKLKSKTFTSQKNELLCKVIAHNIVVLTQEMYELNVKPIF